MAVTTIEHLVIYATDLSAPGVGLCDFVVGLEAEMIHVESVGSGSFGVEEKKCDNTF
jgi:hypothetical protein